MNCKIASNAVYAILLFIFLFLSMFHGAEMILSLLLQNKMNKSAICISFLLPFCLYKEPFLLRIFHMQTRLFAITSKNKAHCFNQVQ